jgi:hypothetical protein
LQRAFASCSEGKGKQRKFNHIRAKIRLY